MIRDGNNVIITAKTYENLHQRILNLEMQLHHAERDRESTMAWARNACAEERRLADRLTFVYGVARAHGATVEELS